MAVLVVMLVVMRVVLVVLVLAMLVVEVGGGDFHLFNPIGG